MNFLLESPGIFPYFLVARPLFDAAWPRCWNFQPLDRWLTPASLFAKAGFKYVHYRSVKYMSDTGNNSEALLLVYN
jgi:hypothetical protein